MPKAYPAYWGTYNRFSKVQKYLDSIENLYLIGRNGMHRYNNQDHSMLTAMLAVEHIRGALKSRQEIWALTLEEDYHEIKTESSKRIRAERPGFSPAPSYA